MELKQEITQNGVTRNLYITPSEPEMRLVNKVQRECRFFRLAIKACRDQVTLEYLRNPDKVEKEGFRKCGRALQEEFECSTYGLLEQKVDDHQKSRIYISKFSECFFKDLKQLGLCSKFLDDNVRRLFRMEDSPLKSRNRGVLPM